MSIISNYSPPNKKAIICGHFCLDLLPDLSGVPSGKFFTLFTPGHLLQSGKMNIATGGAASNTGISFHKLGIPASIIARLGKDELGNLAVKHMEHYVPSDSIHLNLVDGETTSYTVIINPPGVDRIFLHHPGANDHFTDDDVDFKPYEDHVLFHYGYPQLMRAMYVDGGKRLVSLFKQAKQHGFTTSLDTTFPDPSSDMGKVDWSKVLKKALPYVDIFCPSFEEAFFMLDRAGFEAYSTDPERSITPMDVIPLLKHGLEYGAKIVCLKLGKTGGVIATSKELSSSSFGKSWFPALASWQNRLLWAPSYCVDVVGTTGAGDAAIAGFLGGLLNELSIEETMLMAMGVGGCNVEAIDSVSAVRSWQDTVHRINCGWQQNPLNLASYGWIFNVNTMVWEKDQ
jgi:sugar/nucleoside kinase (ribokinase family)